jgi:tetratricopeptide (TPR) repeat protein
MGTWAPVCESRIVRFWQAFTGCDTPLQGRERDTFIYWDPARAAAFQAYGLPGIAQAMTNGRARWQQACAADHGAVAVREPELRAQLPLPVPVLAVQPVGVVVPGQTPQLGEGFRLMVEGNFDGALGVLTQIWENEPTPLVTFSIGVCHDRLGARQEALVHYQEVTSDPTLGPPAQARMTLLTADGGTPSASARRRAQQNFVQAGEHFQGGNHGAAIEAFQRSYAAVPHARTLFNIAFCYQSMGQILPALAYYFIVAHDDSVDEETRNQSIVALRQLAQEHLREMGQ